MLGGAKLTAFVATTDSARAKTFYQGTLGLRLLNDNQFALAFDPNGTQLRVQKVEKCQPQPFTVLGWEVSDIRRAIGALANAGVEFERYDFLQQDDLGIWKAPSGTKVAWFKDPDANLLSLAESGAA
jgi:catechol 2,3-dioxygenase-like lactoylglutathione lyase family enzyme